MNLLRTAYGYLRRLQMRRALEQMQGRIAREVNEAFPFSAECFPTELRLPLRYGRALPERVVELLLARLSYAPGLSVLDVGHSNIMKCQKDMMKTLPPPRHFTGIDIATPVYNVSEFYERSVQADITNSGLSADSFDLIWCISAIEHIGMDNSGYTGEFILEKSLDFTAIQSMMVLLKPGGRLLVTVPYGRTEDHRSFRNYDETRWNALLDTVRSSGDALEFYFRHTFGKGWETVQPEELRHIGYYDQANSGAAGLAAAYIRKNTREL